MLVAKEKHGKVQHKQGAGFGGGSIHCISPFGLCP